MAAQSMWRYPDLSAVSTARSTSPGIACHVPNPTAGICTPVLRVKCVGIGMVAGFVATEESDAAEEL